MLRPPAPPHMFSPEFLARTRAGDEQRRRERAAHEARTEAQFGHLRRALAARDAEAGRFRRAAGLAAY